MSDHLHRRSTQPRRKRVPWSLEEVHQLMLAVEKHGKGKWAEMLMDSTFRFSSCRERQDLRIKYRNEERKMRSVVTQKVFLEPVSEVPIEPETPNNLTQAVDMSFDVDHHGISHAHQTVPVANHSGISRTHQQVHQANHISVWDLNASTSTSFAPSGLDDEILLAEFFTPAYPDLDEYLN